MRAQQYSNFRVLMSIDGDDVASSDVCERFTTDPRFQLVQHHRIGRVANLNFLLSQVREDFYVYLQQDDRLHPRFLAVLAEQAQAHPAASSIYADCEWFGLRSGRIENPPLTGSPLERVLEQIERPRIAPIRGLIRRQALERAGPINANAYDSVRQDKIWLAKLAREGDFVRVPETLYFKRRHEGATGLSWKSWPADRRRGAWLEAALGAIEAALPLVPASDHTRILTFVADRFVIPRPGRDLYFNALAAGEQEATRFVHDLLSEAWIRFGTLPFPNLLGASRPVDALASGQAACEEEPAVRLMIQGVLDHLEYWLSALAGETAPNRGRPETGVLAV